MLFPSSLSLFYIGSLVFFILSPYSCSFPFNYTTKDLFLFLSLSLFLCVYVSRRAWRQAGDGAERKGGRHCDAWRRDWGPWLDPDGRRVSSGCNIGSRSFASREKDFEGISKGLRVHNTNAHSGRKYPVMRWSISFLNFLRDYSPFVSWIERCRQSSLECMQDE